MNRHRFGLALASAAFLVVTGCGDGAAEEERASPLAASRSAVQDRRIASQKVQQLSGLSSLPHPDDNVLGAALRRHYPAELRGGGISGSVLIDVAVNDRGHVESARAVAPASLPNPTDEHRIVVRERVPGSRDLVERELALRYDTRFAPAAEAALREVPFRPAMRDGRAAPFTIRMTVTFTPPVD
ncbi:hypothetical protein [Longimicrobium sp.]|uniref:hypothetical protein n=1 Tax=Longimicrobium sp. TaxID=2029185 RepID=UPI002EDB509B